MDGRESGNVRSMGRGEIMGLFARQEFRDPLGHPLTLCRDFLDLVERAAGQDGGETTNQRRSEVDLSKYAATPHPTREVFRRHGVPIVQIANYIGRSYARTSNYLSGIYRARPEIEAKLWELAGMLDAKDAAGFTAAPACAKPASKPEPERGGAGKGRRPGRAVGAVRRGKALRRAFSRSQPR